MGHALAFDTLTLASDLQEAGMDESRGSCHRIIQLAGSDY
jgi:hypothetical protein